MKKRITTLITALLVTFSLFSTTHIVNSGDYYYSPQVLTIDVGDTVKWVNDGGYHNVNFDTSTVTNVSFNNPESFISTATSGAVIYTHVFIIAGTYEYDCSVGQHAAFGMTGNVVVNLIPADCNGITNGPAIEDSCGVCQQAYTYDYVTNAVTMLDDTAGIVLGATEMIVMPDSPNNPLWNSSCSNTIYDIVSNSTDHTTLKQAIDLCSLNGVLSGPGPYTLFAPTNTAFNALPAGTISSLISNIPLLTDILKHHVVGDSVMSGMLLNGQIVTTLLGTDVTVTITATGDIYIESALVTLANITADNGVVHVIDAVLLPVIDCNGIVDGTSLEDTCGTCHQAYIYDVITHAVTFLDDTTGVGATLAATEQLIMPDNPMNPYWNAACTNSIYDIVSNSPDHTTLKAAIDACSLDMLLSAAGPYTLFAPTDAAFNALPSGTVAALLVNLPTLTDILKHHVVGDSVMSGMLSNSQIVTTLLGTDVTVTITATGDVYIDNAMVTLANITADNGVVHVIDAVLLPPTNTIYDIVSNSTDHTTLKTAIDACSLDAYLSGPGPHTLFAPTDAAFNALPAGTITTLLSDIPALTDILKHHVVGDSVLSAMLLNGQIVTTLLGDDVTVTITATGDVYIDNAMVTLANIPADNGVVHIIDAVLIPEVNSVHDLNLGNKSVYMYSIDILGKKISKDLRNQIVFDIFSNGEVTKRYTK